MREAFVNCDWVIVPYNSASQSGIIIDAYKYSRPVIAFAVGAIPEQVDANKSGYLVTAAKQLRYLAGSPVHQCHALSLTVDAADVGGSHQPVHGGCDGYYDLIIWITKSASAL